MRLLECYIEAFGKLRDFKYTFSEGLNVITEDNGFGKTTLTAFIKAMFYGLDDNRKQKIEENDRRHYAPWGGGKFGGWLSFKVGALSYRIERTFGTKASLDTYALYDLESGNICHMYGENIGESLFGIDADGFERTLFLSERRLSVQNDNKSVSAKLSDLVGYEWDVGALDTALRELEERRKYYYKRGGSGKISEIRDEIAEIENEIIRVRQIIDALPEKEAMLSELHTELLRLEDTRKEIITRSATINIQKQYLRIKAELSELQGRREEELGFFCEAVPTNAELTSVEGLINESCVLLGRIKAKEESIPKNYDGKELDKLNSYIDYINKNGTKTKHKVPPVLLFMLSVVMAGVGAVLAGTGGLAVGITLIFLSTIPLAVGVAIAASPRGELRGMLLEIKNYLDTQGRGYATRESFLTELIDIRARCEASLSQIEAEGQELATLKERLSEINTRIDEFLSRFNTVTDDPIGEIRRRLIELEVGENAIRRKSAELDAFVNENGIDTASAADEAADGELYSIDPAELEEKIKALRAKITILEGEYRTSADAAGAIDELNERLAEAKDRLADANDRYNTIIAVSEQLIKAKDSLTSKYLGKTRERFNEYIALMTKESPELFTISVDFGVKRIDGATTHTEAEYSLGTREAYVVAARLALIDSLYEGEVPFILLDDPFCHLDDKKCALALKVVKRLSLSRQIIYLTCSKSRAV